MILTKILFLVLILVCAAFYILYVWDFALVLLVAMIALPVVMFVSTLLAKRKIKAEFAVRDKAAEKNTDFPVQLCITNKSLIPIGKAEAHIEYYNVFNNQISTFELYLPIQSRNSQRVTFQFSSKFCGIVKIKTSCIYIYDPLRIFRFKTGKNIRTEIAVMPECHDISGFISYTDRINEESNVFSDNRPGDDPSEVFELRDYIAGDKINRIHWKLSSKRDEFIVKEYSLPVDVPCTIFLNLKCYEDSDYTLPIFDTLVDTLFSISQFLIENERIHSVIYYNAAHKQFVERTIYNADVLADMIRELVLSISDNLSCETPESYFADNSVASLSSFTFITSSTDASMLDYIDDNVDADIKNAVIVVKSPDEISLVSRGFSSLKTMPVVIGRVSSSIKDLEI